MRTRYKISALVILAGAILFGGISATRPAQATEVKIEPVIHRDLVASVTASGRVRPHTKVDVSLDITGRITQLSVKEGDIIRKGQFLLQIDPSASRAAVERAQATVAASQAQAAQAQANFLQAQSSYNRTAELKRRNPALVADEQLEQLKTTMTVDHELVESAKNDIQQSMASLRDAENTMAKTTVVAPIAGQITRLNVQEGETAIMGTLNKDAATLLTISDMTVLETQVKVDETDVSRLKIGDSAIVRLDAFPDTTFPGVVTDISNSSTSDASTTAGSGDQAVDYTVTVRLRNASRNIRPDFSATAKIITDVRPHALTIPIVALTVRDHASGRPADSASQNRMPAAKSVGQKEVEGVFVIGKDSRVTFRPVRVGVAGERYFEVLGGVQQGDRIVGGTYQAIRTLKDGVKVRASDATSADSAGS